MRKLRCFVLLLVWVPLLAQESVMLVKDGKAQFRIVTADKLEGDYGPKDLAEFTKKATGASVKIVPAGKLPQEKEDLINIYIGSRSYGDKYHYDYPVPAGFRIIFPDDRNIIIAGALLAGGEANTNDGVYWFLETYLDVHFLMPGEVGEYVPKTKDWSVPKKDVQRVPAFFSRIISGVHGQAYAPADHYNQKEAIKFAMRKSMSSSASLKLSHNVGNLIDPEIYGKTHLEFFPLINGKRFVPPKVQQGEWKLYNWEPCYTAPGIAEEAAKNVMAFFDKHPTLYTCSLSVNDTGNICQCDNCLRVNQGLPRGSESQSYYEWVSKVVNIVDKKYPDRTYGILNYWVTKELPKNLKLPPSVVPVICEDFHFYLDKTMREKQEARLKNWDEIASTLCWWDYSFEGDYMIPAYTPHFRAKHIKHLYKNHNLRAYMDEMSPGPYFKNAPEVYMLMKLLWDIEADPEALLDEWYRLAAGPAAAPCLKEYFEIWEKIWYEKIPRTKWFKERAALGAPFLQRSDDRYLDAVSLEDLDRAMAAIKKAYELAPEGRERQRVEFFYRYIAMEADTYILPYLNCRELLEKGDAAEGRQLRKYNFKTTQAPWVDWQLEKHTAILRHTTEEGHQGKGALELNFAESLPTSMVYFLRPLEVKLKPGKNYRVSVWCKGRGLGEKDAAQMALFFKKRTKAFRGREEMLSLRTALSSRKLQDGEWHKMSLYIAVPPTAWAEIDSVDCQLEAYVGKFHGTVFYDDLTIEEINIPGFACHPEYGIRFPEKKQP